MYGAIRANACNIAFILTVFKEYPISFLMVSRLIDFALVILKLLIASQKLIFFNFLVLKELKRNQKKLKTNENLLFL